MKGRIVSRPLSVELHSCPTPGVVSRWLRRMKEGTVWRCDCDNQWVLTYDRDLYEGDDAWAWELVPPPILYPDDPGPIRTSKRRTP